MLPDVVQNRQAASRRALGDGIEQRIIGAARRGELHADRAGGNATVDLRRARALVSLGLTATYQRTRSRSRLAIACIASLPSVVSAGDAKYVGEYRPHEPRIEAMCDRDADARRRRGIVRDSARPSLARPQSAKKKCA